jgi:type II secretion system protein I
MRSTIKKRPDLGFTLIEVLVALAIASGALILILSANGASMRKSVQARLSERLERAAESKLAELSAGAERANEGMLAGFDGHRWEIRARREDGGSLKKLSRITFKVTGPGGTVLEWQQLRHLSEEAP